MAYHGHVRVDLGPVLLEHLADSQEYEAHAHRVLRPCGPRMSLEHDLRPRVLDSGLGRPVCQPLAQRLEEFRGRTLNGQNVVPVAADGEPFAGRWWWLMDVLAEK